MENPSIRFHLSDDLRSHLNATNLKPFLCLFAYVCFMYVSVSSYLNLPVTFSSPFHPVVSSFLHRGSCFPYIHRLLFYRLLLLWFPSYYGVQFPIY